MRVNDSIKLESLVEGYAGRSFYVDVSDMGVDDGGGFWVRRNAAIGTMDTFPMAVNIYVRRSHVLMGWNSLGLTMEGKTRSHARWSRVMNLQRPVNEEIWYAVK